VTECTQILDGFSAMLRQCVFGLCLGYEELNDHQTLRDDPAMQTVLAAPLIFTTVPSGIRFSSQVIATQVEYLATIVICRLLLRDFAAEKPPCHESRESDLTLELKPPIPKMEIGDKINCPSALFYQHCLCYLTVVTIK